MNESDIFKNIEIAKKYLARFNLLLPDDEILLECCYFPPFSEKAFYARVFCKNGTYRAHYAFTYCADFWGLESCSQTFETVENADKHNAKVGNVICKTLNLDSEKIHDLMRTVEKVESEYNEVCIDGISAYVRTFPNERELYFLNTVGKNEIFDKLESAFSFAKNRNIFL